MGLAAMPTGMRRVVRQPLEAARIQHRLVIEAEEGRLPGPSIPEGRIPCAFEIGTPANGHPVPLGTVQRAARRPRARTIIRDGALEVRADIPGAVSGVA